MINFIFKNKRNLISLLLFLSFTVQSSNMNKHDIPSAIFNYPDDFLSALSIPMPKNENEYFELVNKANTGDPEANWMLAVIQHTVGNYQAASERYNLSISRNDKYKPKSMINLGFIFEKENKFAEARSLFERAGEIGHFEGYRTIGTNYLNGTGVKQNFSKAKEYYKKASQIGCYECTYFINNWDEVVKLKKSEK
ncbi:Similarities with eukaryotic protein [Xenorhabdus nematophila F1]|uniref:tetratricopeptide repeat protein n=1 Tax=Xenorhabdus nematophila TaxID=628 RepID=UPI0003275D21|nr:sel1 repeat family protein [Xenorhabdus nematophila]CCW31262.1 Similarities with eukaryotic protein [Xenorhabdus nematophila F1]CEE91688.1 Similarities with eukaryotic protein [Xenorhabdus nematophila str. Anatoliense]CEE95550.1 Similarities with eukaryotic protein [Xenorhabdus nematophila str. Anatoliense]